MRNLTTIIGTVALCAFTMSTPAVLASFSPVSGGGADDALAVVKAADKATSEIQAATYDFKYFGADGLESRVTPSEGSAKVMRGSDEEKDCMWVDWTTKRGETTVHMTASMDGTKAFVINPAAKTLEWSKVSDGGDELFGQSGAFAGVMREYIHSDPFQDEINGDSLKLEGTKEIGGEKCDIVHVVYADNQGEARWYFDQKDHLPRRVDRIYAGQGSVAMEVSHLVPNAKLTVKDFELTAPDGFAVKQHLTAVPVGEMAPDWSLKDGEGKTVKLSELKGNVVMLDFWATWCGPCNMAMPGVQKMADHYKGKNVKIIGVDTWERPDGPDPVKYMKDKGYTYMIVLKGDDAAKDYYVSGIPTFYIIGTDGKVVYHGVGYDPKNEVKLTEIIDKALSVGNPGM